MEYINRLQQAIDYVETHLEDNISVDDMASIACYSRSHFIWLFECATRIGPMEYVRKRRLTEAAAALKNNPSIMDVALQYNFSSQDAFTRSFHHEFGIPPGMYRKSIDLSIQPFGILNLLDQGDKMKLKTLVASYNGKARVEIEQYLTEDVLDTISSITLKPQRLSKVDPEVMKELTQMRVLQEDKGLARLATAVFLEADMNLFYDTATSIGNALAQAVESAGKALLGEPPVVRSYVAGILGMGHSYVEALREGGWMSNWKDLDGKYGHSKVDFDQVCDAYDRYGPDLLVINTNRGEHYSAIVIGPSTETFFSYLLEWRKAARDDATYNFATSLTKHLTDAFAMLAEGSLHSQALLSAAETAHMAENGKILSTVIKPAEAKRYAVVVTKIAAAVKDIARETADQATAMLLQTTSGRQGVKPEALMLNFHRYVRKLASQKLYQDGYFTDRIPELGIASLFYENTCTMIGAAE